MSETLDRVPSQEQLEAWLSDFIRTNGDLATQCLDANLKKNLHTAIVGERWGCEVDFDKLWNCYENVTGLLLRDRARAIYELTDFERRLLSVLAGRA